MWKFRCSVSSEPGMQGMQGMQEVVLPSSPYLKEPLLVLSLSEGFVDLSKNIEHTEEHGCCL